MQLFFYLMQPELYKKDLTRQESTESSSTADMEYAGKLHFALRYDKEIEGLVVKVSSWKIKKLQEIIFFFFLGFFFTLISFIHFPHFTIVSSNISYTLKLVFSQQFTYNNFYNSKTILFFIFLTLIKINLIGILYLINISKWTFIYLIKKCSMIFFLNLFINFHYKFTE